jgi:hypothetical protein
MENKWSLQEVYGLHKCEWWKIQKKSGKQSRIKAVKVPR